MNFKFSFLASPALGQISPKSDLEKLRWQLCSGFMRKDETNGNIILPPEGLTQICISNLLLQFHRETVSIFLKLAVYQNYIISHCEIKLH